MFDGIINEKQMEERAVVAKSKLAPDVATRFIAKAKSCVKPIAKSSGKAPNKVRGKVKEILLPGSVLGTIADAEVAVTLTSAEDV